MRAKLLLLIWAWVLAVTSGCGAAPVAVPPAAPLPAPAAVAEACADRTLMDFPIFLGKPKSPVVPTVPFPSGSPSLSSGEGGEQGACR